MRREEQRLTEQADLILQVLNQQRHDWLNHVQVLLGYLKMGRPEQGELYLKRVCELACQESMIARINLPSLSVFFLTFNAIHRDLLLEVELENQPDLSKLTVDHEWFAALIMDIVFAIKTYQRKPEYEVNSLLLSFTAGSNQLEISFDLAGSLSASGNEEVEKLLVRGQTQDIMLEEWAKSEDEWILTLRVPCCT